MKFIADLHMHNSSCVHAYSSIDEIALAAEEKNLKCIALTEHGPATADAPKISHFFNMHVVPSHLHGVRILKGAETGLTAPFGNPDLPDFLLQRLDFVIASMHTELTGMPQRYNKSDYTNAYIRALENPYIDALGHLLRYGHEIYIEPVIKTAAKHNKIIEINELSFARDKSYADVFLPVLEMCKKYGVHIMLSSDAHHASLIGKFETGIQLVKQTDYPQELIVNSSQERLLNYLNGRPLKNKITL